MSLNEKCITLIWKILDFNFCFIRTSNVTSPLFFVHEMGGTKWRLCLHPNSLGFKSCIACGIVAEETAVDAYEFEFDYEISILSSDGSVQHSEIFLKKLYKGGYEDWSAALHVKSDEVFLPAKDMFVHDNFLTIRCRIWDKKNLLSLSGRYFAKTILVTRSISFEGKIENISNLEPKGKYPFLMSSSSKALNLCVTVDGKLAIEMEQSASMYSYIIYIHDVSKNRVKFGQGYVHDCKLYCLPLTISKQGLLRNKKYYLSNDTLTIECKVKFPTGKTTESAFEPEYGFEYQDTQNLMITEEKRSVVFSEKQHLENLTTLKDDFTSLFEEGVLCDTKLKTDTEIFPAHTVVLSARSPVFQAMFTSDMKEKTSSCVNIDDLDADTVRRMLLFMYSANLDDLEYDSAKRLYFAADKYNIVSLLQRCSDFLKQNLMESNCCDIFLLADNHDDKDLKSAVIDYIAIHDEVYLLSEEWKNLEKNRPQLTIEAFRAISMKKRGS